MSDRALQGHETLPPPHAHEIAPGVLAYVQPDGSWMVNNTGALLAADGVVLVDMTSTERRNRAFLDAVDTASGGVPVRTLLNTHHHGDHTFGNWLVGATTIVSSRPARAEVLRAGFVAADLFDADYGHLELAPPTLTFDDAITIHAGDLRAEMLFVGPAHTLGDAVVWLPEQKVVFAGDLVFNGGHPFLVEGCLANFGPAIDRIRGLDAQIVVPGHGDIGGPELLDDMTAYSEWLTGFAALAHRRGWTPREAVDHLTEVDGAERFAGWQEDERLVGNLHRAYSEISGAPWGSPLDLAVIVAEMVAFHGGPMRCLA